MKLKNLTCNTDKSLKLFKNLRELVYLEFNYLHYSGKLFGDLTRLESLECYSITRESLDKLRNEKNELQRKNLIIYYKGVDISAESFNYDLFFDVSTNCLNQNQMDLLLEYLDHLNETLCQKKFYKIDLEKMPIELLRKFDYLEEMVLTIKLTNLERFKEILNFYRLKALKVKVWLNNKYLNQIPVYQPLIRCLKINSCNNDMSFILRLKFLKQLHVKQQFLGIQIFKSMLESMKYLEDIHILKFFQINLTDKMISCYQSQKDNDREITFKENRAFFLKTTINFIQDLTELFTRNVPYSEIESN